MVYPDMRVFLVPFLISILLLGFTTGLRAADLVVGVEDLRYLPYYSVGEGEYKGFARDLLDTFADEQGHSIHYRPLPVERLYRALFDGSIDFKFPDNPKWRQALKEGKKLHYSHAVVPFIDGVMVAPGGKDKLAKPYKIGTVRGFTPWVLLDDIKRGAVELSENNSISGLLRQVIAGRLDGAYINVEVARFYLNNVLRHKDALVLDERQPHARSVYHVSSISKPGIIQEFNDWLGKNAVRVQSLKHKWAIEQ